MTIMPVVGYFGCSSSPKLSGFVFRSSVGGGGNAEASCLSRIRGNEKLSHGSLPEEKAGEWEMWQFLRSFLSSLDPEDHRKKTYLPHPRLPSRDRTERLETSSLTKPPSLPGQGQRRPSRELRLCPWVVTPLPDPHGASGHLGESGLPIRPSDKEAPLHLTPRGVSEEA